MNFLFTLLIAICSSGAAAAFMECNTNETPLQIKIRAGNGSKHANVLTWKHDTTMQKSSHGVEKYEIENTIVMDLQCPENIGTSIHTFTITDHMGSNDFSEVSIEIHEAPKPSQSKLPPFQYEPEETDPTTDIECSTPCPGVLTYFGSNPNCKLQECGGNCNADSDCSPGLFCLKSNGQENRVVPGCSTTPYKDSNYCVSDKYQRNLAMSNQLSGVVLNENSSMHRMKMQRTSRSSWKYFSTRDELRGEVIKYCNNPDNYDTSEYGYVMRLVLQLIFVISFIHSG